MKQTLVFRTLIVRKCNPVSVCKLTDMKSPNSVILHLDEETGGMSMISGRSKGGDVFWCPCKPDLIDYHLYFSKTVTLSVGTSPPL